jgi:hypothetical protein
MALEDAFPELRKTVYEITNPASSAYNCIAWAAEEHNQWWEPAQGYYWPADVPSEYTVAALVQRFESIGYERCPSADPEAGFNKVAIYGQEGEYTHAARQLPNGRWTSKLGAQVDIEHDTLDDLVGEEYGAVVCIVKRVIRS